MLKKLAKLFPLALLGVTMSGNVPTLETADITSLGSTVAGQMGGFITNALMIAGIGLILVFGFLVVNSVFRMLKLKKGGRRRR